MTPAEQHSQAMDIAEEAFRLSRTDHDAAKSLFVQAYLIERRIADAIPAEDENEPSRSIMYRSAASLALNGGLLREAEVMACQGLVGNPPEEIATELREVFEQSNFERHLDASGIDLRGNELLLTFLGNEVGAGYIKASELTDRLDIFTDITRREVERLSKRPFQSAGRPAKVVNMYAPYLGASMTGSYKIIMQLGKNEEESLFSGYFPFQESIIDNIIDGFTLINDNQIDELRARYSDVDQEYFDFFTSSAKSFAPDGHRIKAIGFTRRQDGVDEHFMFRRDQSNISLATIEPITDEFDLSLASGKTSLIVVEGVLDLAKSRNKQKFIEVMSAKQTKPFKFQISEGKLAAIVRDNYESLVKVTGRMIKGGKKPEYEFVDIENLDDNNPNGDFPGNNMDLF